MTVPDEHIFRAMLANQGLSLSDERLTQALAGHVGMRAELEALRAVPLSFLDPFEPGTALQWIEQGGREPAGPAQHDPAQNDPAQNGPAS